jgi:hypothetical protein
MAKKQKNAPVSGGESAISFFANPVLGSTLTVLSWLSFLILCMLLSMVGQAAAATQYAAQNRRAFGIFLLISFVLSILAVLSKLARRRLDESPLPYFSFGTLGLTVFLYIAFLARLLEV